jgi:hypothetical protein
MFKVNNLISTTAISISRAPAILVRISPTNPLKSIFIPLNIEKEIEKEENRRSNRPEEYIVDTSNQYLFT